MKSKCFSIPETEIELNAVRSQGAGGQNVNKVSSAIHLRFDIVHSSLPDAIKQRLLALHDHRITKDGVIIIKAQTFRTQEKNRMAALRRLEALIDSVTLAPSLRKPTRPTRASQTRRLEKKTLRGKLKRLRGGIDD